MQHHQQQQSQRRNLNNNQQSKIISNNSNNSHNHNHNHNHNNHKNKNNHTNNHNTNNKKKQANDGSQSVPGLNSRKSAKFRGNKIVYQIEKYNFRIYEHFRPTRILGIGAYGVVVAATDSRTKGIQKVAIKKNAHVFNDAQDARRILREVYLLMNFHHLDIIRCLDVISPDENERFNFNSVYLVMPFMETNLKTVILAKHVCITAQHQLLIVYQLLRGLKYLHSANIVHRDLKPDNILFNLTKCKIKIADFGLARGVFANNDLTEYVCTRWYRAPEIMLSPKKYGVSVDMWSVGCIFVELIIREAVFPGESFWDQATQIFRKIGYPPTRDYGWITIEADRQYIRKIPYDQHKYNLRNVLFECDADPEAIDLIAQCLEINPLYRISIVDALATPYFKKLHNPTNESELSAESQTNLANFEQSIQHKNALQLREIMFQYLTNFDPRWKHHKKIRVSHKTSNSKIK